MSKLLLFALFISFAKGDLEAKVNDLIKLIQDETERAETYLLPNNAEEYRPSSEQHTSLGTFDHIIIGAGSAGAIVAARSSEDSNKSILLLEAGDKETDFTDIPAMITVSLGLQYNWNYKSTAQNNSCQLFTNGVCDYAAGRGLGGSTIVNGLVYARGCKWDYDNWASLGNDLWGYDEVLPFFKKLENYQISGDDGYHGYSGPINVEYSEPLNPRTTIFLDANRELGKAVGDYNGENPFRAGRIPVNHLRGQRCSTGRAYLRRVWKYRKNLHVLTRSYVTKVLVDAQTKRAYGVVFAKDNKYYTAKSRKEIVLSAGVYRSPQILMLSGIGPKEHLMNLNIPVIHDLPVGKVFKDHLAYYGLHVHTNQSNNEQTLSQQVKDYLHSKGMLTEGAGYGAVFLKSNLSSVPQRPEIEVVMYEFVQSFNILFNITDIRNAVTIISVLLHPKSNGSLTLGSSDPFEYPVINPNFFSDPNDEDLNILLEGIRYVLELINTEPFKKVNATLMRVHLPECKDYTYLSNEYFRCHSKYFVDVSLHAIATCQMGPNPSEGAVVDQKLRVHGITNLMVADASVMPDSMSGHTSAPSMMIGERAAHIIKFGRLNY